MSQLRPDLAVISNWIKPGSRILDLGCGDGMLFAYLRECRQITGYGVEIDDFKLAACVRNGVPVIQQDLDHGLKEFADQAFDYVILSLTLQATYYPVQLLLEMLRVGREVIVTFPNFGHWHSRWQIAVKGHMPVTDALPHQWYNTPNVRLCTIQDFEKLCRDHAITVLERKVLDDQHRESWLNVLAPNLFGEIALYRCARLPLG